MSAPIALLQFLAALFGSEPDGAWIELRVRHRNGTWAQHWFDIRDLKRVAREAIVMSRDADVYIGIAPRTRREGKRSAVARCHALFVDVDGGLEKARAFRPKPSIANRSGSGGAHLFWVLADPIGPDELEVANRRLAQGIGGDMRATDAPRILRVPFTQNWKHAEPRPVELVRCVPEIFTVAEVVGHLPPLQTPSRPASDRARRDLDPNDTLAAIAPPVYVGRLTGLDVPERGGMVSCPFPGHRDSNPSHCIYPGAEQGTWCFGCQRGGDIWTFASELWGMDLHGRGFHDVRRRLLAELLGRTEEAA